MTCSIVVYCIETVALKQLAIDFGETYETFPPPPLALFALRPFLSFLPALIAFSRALRPPPPLLAVGGAGEGLSLGGGGAAAESGGVGTFGGGGTAADAILGGGGMLDGGATGGGGAADCDCAIEVGGPLMSGRESMFEC